MLGQRLNLSPGEGAPAPGATSTRSRPPPPSSCCTSSAGSSTASSTAPSRGVEVDAEGMRRVREAARLSRRAPLILVPSHKSHMDYLWILGFHAQRVHPPTSPPVTTELLPRRVPRPARSSCAAASRVCPSHAVFRRYLWKLVGRATPSSSSRRAAAAPASCSAQAGHAQHAGRGGRGER
ncbi:MAG: hypothetical protein R3F43_12900 [bacterium]